MRRYEEEIIKTAFQEGWQEGWQEGIQEVRIEENQSRLIRVMTKKFGLTSEEKTMILNCKDAEVLDDALDCLLFAVIKEEVLKIIDTNKLD